MTRHINSDLHIELDRASTQSLSEQIRISITKAIDSGLLAPGTRLPSWQDLAAHLGVARGTVQAAYERLSDFQMIETFGARGTLVAPRPDARSTQPQAVGPDTCARKRDETSAGPAIFQLGIPALEGQPERLFARARSSNLLKPGPFSSLGHPDPSGEFELRREIAGHLSISRNIHCLPEQVFITSGYSSGLDLTLRVLGLDGRKVWMEEPGFYRTRKALQLARLRIVPVPVDAGGTPIHRLIINPINDLYYLLNSSKNAAVHVSAFVSTRRLKRNRLMRSVALRLRLCCRTGRHVVSTCTPSTSFRVDSQVHPLLIFIP